MRNSRIPSPDALWATCVHPRCEKSPQARYDFPLPLCGEHLVQTLTAAVQVTRAAKLDYTKANQGKLNPFPESARLPHKEVVYYIKFGDRIKIGTTTNLKRRLDNLPFDQILGIEPGGVDVERQRHEQFATDRVSGREWFTPSEALMSHIAKLKKNPRRR